MQTQSQTTATEQPLLDPVPPAGQEDRVESVFARVQEHLGFVPDGLRLYSFSPPLLEAFVANIGYFRDGTGLPPVLTTFIRYLVSSDAGCQFCIDLNEGFLSHLGVDIDAARAARRDPDAAPLEPRERLLLKLALKSVDSPQHIAGDDLEAVRAQGWSDRDIFDAVVQAANNRAFNFVLRTFNVERQGVFA